MSSAEARPKGVIATGSKADEIEEFAAGEVRVRHGIVNRWLLVVYLGLFVWGMYYLFTYWGGLGPGLAY